MSLSLAQWKEILSPEAFERLKEEYERALQVGSSGTTPNVERNAGNGRVEEKKAARFNTLVCINIHSLRRRLADSDGISGKSAIDGLVKGGILPDDRPEYVESVSFTQEKSNIEKTIITIYERE